LWIYYDPKRWDNVNNNCFYGKKCIKANN
jgi:hypothetical protein